MTHLLNLASAIALLIWGTHLVRNNVLEAYGSALRSILARGIRNRWTGALAGLAVTIVLQSRTATALIVSSFFAQGLVGLPLALAVMLGADIGTSLTTAAFSLDLSWLSPLFILAGVVLYTSRPETSAGRTGQILIGLGLMLLALHLISSSAELLTQSEAARTLLSSITSDTSLEIMVGVLLVLVTYSSLAVVLLIATMAASGTIPLDVALGLVLGANLGGGLLPVLTMARSGAAARQVPVGNLALKLGAIALGVPLADGWLHTVALRIDSPYTLVILFHLGFNLCSSLLLLGLSGRVAAGVHRFFPVPGKDPLDERPNHLDPSVLSTPALAISCAVREALHQADVTETMLRGMLTVIRTDDLALARRLRQMDDTVDTLYSSIKYYLTKISQKTLSEDESHRSTDIISFTINLEQIGDIIERVLLDVEDKKIKSGRAFSDAGMEEICALHARLLDNLQLAMSVFLNGKLEDAQKLIEEKARFRDLERECAAAHLKRLTNNTMQSIETSSLHLDLISDLRRINSLLCSVAYPILESAGALAPSRLRQQVDVREESATAVKV